MAQLQVVGGLKGGPDLRPPESHGGVDATFLYPLEITFPAFLYALGNLWPYLMYCVSVFLR